MSGSSKAPADRKGSGGGGTRPAAERLQPKLKVGDVNDPMEHEADAVARQVVAAQPAATVSRMAAPEKKQEPVRRAAAPEKKQEPVRRAAAPEKKQEPVRRAAAPEKKEEPVRRAPIEDDLQAKSAGGSASSDAMSSAAQHAVDSKGSGRPLDSSVRSQIESSTGTDMGHVRVHDDAGARASAGALNARAFTHGSDIWMGPGESSSDVHLMAHEAAHVIQQGSAAQRLVQRNGTPPAGAAVVPPVSAAQAEQDLHTFKLPPIKARHRSLYETWAQQGTLKRTGGYERGEPEQRDEVWIPLVTLPQARLDTLGLTATFTGTKKVKVGTHERTGNLNQLLQFLKVPQWDRNGTWQQFPMEVDHIIELQVGSWGGGNTGPANEIQNMELLDKSSNASAGSRTRISVRNTVRQYLEDTGAPAQPSNVTSYLQDDLAFNRVEIGTDGSAGGQWWSRAEIQAGDHLSHVTDIGNLDQAGSADSFALVSAGGSVLAQYPHTGGAASIAIPAGPEQRVVAGLIISNINLSGTLTTAAVDAQVGTAQATFELPRQLTKAQTPFPITLLKGGQSCAYLGNPPGMGDAHFAPLSLMTFEPPIIDGSELVARARLTPSLPLLGTTPIDVVLQGNNLALVYFYSAGELALPLPGIHIDDATLGIMFGTEGFRAEGAVYFSVDRLGHGSLGAGIDGSGNFEASGSFDFDSELFDEARIEVWYRERAFGGRGTLRITNPEKVRGIRGLDAEVTFSETSVTATGTVRPDIPGVQTATLRLEYTEADGLLIGGSATLSDGVPGIRSGSLEAEVRRPSDGGPYQLSARGTAVPAIPGLDTTLTVAYDDGALTIEGSADYSRGMLSGHVELGATNRTLDETGQPTDEIGTEMRVYGGGQLTVRITPWLEGTVGVRFLPNGEIELTGEIGLPDALDIFPEKRLDRNIFSINLDIPILGFAVAGQRVGIFATIGGGLDLSAGIGPGQLRDLGIGITYNPDHEDQTEIHGGARLVIPAAAGLRLFIRGALGAGIPIVSASLGLEVGGQLGLEGAVEASVDVNWTPSTGLVIDALGEIYVQPKFRFDLTGFLTVDADLFITTINLYEKRWELAAFELGPDLRFGVRFPIHYEEGQPFDISMDDLEFEVPDVDTDALLGDLIETIV